jgi:hypothetical protein
MAMLRKLLSRLTYANVIATTALFLVLAGGSALALSGHSTVFSDDIADDTFMSAGGERGGLVSADIRNDNQSFSPGGQGGLMGQDIRNDTLTGSDINERSLSVPDLGCQTGKILGFAFIDGTAASFPQSYTSDPAFIRNVNNCSGGTVEVRHASHGVYHVRFAGNPAQLAWAAPNGTGEEISGISSDNIFTASKITAGSEAGAFRVESADVDSDHPDDASRQPGQFTILLP